MMGKCQRVKTDKAGRELPWAASGGGGMHYDLIYGPHGWCTSKQPLVRCDCVLDGFAGPTCEARTEAFCPNQCSGRGDCERGWCRCRAGWYGLDCARATKEAAAALPALNGSSILSTSNTSASGRAAGVDFGSLVNSPEPPSPYPVPPVVKERPWLRQAALDQWARNQPLPEVERAEWTSAADGEEALTDGGNQSAAVAPVSGAAAAESASAAAAAKAVGTEAAGVAIGAQRATAGGIMLPVAAPAVAAAAAAVPPPPKSSHAAVAPADDPAPKLAPAGSPAAASKTAAATISAAYAALSPAIAAAKRSLLRHFRFGAGRLQAEAGAGSTVARDETGREYDYEPDWGRDEEEGGSGGSRGGEGGSADSAAGNADGEQGELEDAEGVEDGGIGDKDSADAREHFHWDAETLAARVKELQHQWEQQQEGEQHAEQQLPGEQLLGEQLQQHAQRSLLRHFRIAGGALEVVVDAPDKLGGGGGVGSLQPDGFATDATESILAVEDIESLPLGLGGSQRTQGFGADSDYHTLNDPGEEDVGEEQKGAAGAGWQAQGAGTGAGQRPRRRPLVFVYDMPAEFVGRVLQYRTSKEKCTWRLFGGEGNRTTFAGEGGVEGIYKGCGYGNPQTYHSAWRQLDPRSSLLA